MRSTEKLNLKDALIKLSRTCFRFYSTSVFYSIKNGPFHEQANNMLQHVTRAHSQMKNVTYILYLELCISSDNIHASI